MSWRTVTFILLPLLLLALALAAYVLAPWYGPAVVARLVPDGVQVEHLEIGRPGWRGLSIPAAELVLATAAGPLHLTLDDAALQFDLAARTLTRLAISDVTLRLDTAEGPLDAALRDADLRIDLRARVLTRLSAETLTVALPASPQTRALSVPAVPPLPVGEIAIAHARVTTAGGETIQAESLRLVRDKESVGLEAGSVTLPPTATRDAIRLSSVRVNQTPTRTAVMANLHEPGWPAVSLSAGLVPVGEPLRDVSLTLNDAGATTVALQLQDLGAGHTSGSWELQANVPDLAPLSSLLGRDLDGSAVQADLGGVAQREGATWTIDLREGARAHLSAGTPLRAWIAALPGVELLVPSLPGVVPRDIGIVASGPTHLQVNVGETLRVEGSLQIDSQAEGVSGRLDTTLIQVPLGAHRPVRDHLHLEGRLRADIATPATVTLGGATTAVLRAPALHYEGLVAFADATLSLSPGTGTTVALAGAALNFDDTAVSVSAVQAGLTGQLSVGLGDAPVMRAGQLRLRNTNDVNVRVGDVDFEGLAIDKARSTLIAVWSAGSWWPRLGGPVSAARVAIADRTVTLADSRIRIDEATLSPPAMRGTTAFGHGRLATEVIALDAARAAGRLRVSGKRVQFDGHFTPLPESIEQPVAVLHDFSNNRVRIELPELQLGTAEARPVLNQLVRPRLPQLNVRDVSVRGALWLEAGPGYLAGGGTLALDSITAGLAKLRVTGARDLVELVSLDPLVIRHELNAPEILLGSGLAARNIAATVTTRASGGEVENLRADILGGTVTIPLLTYAGTSLGPLAVGIENIDIGALLAWMDVEGLSGSGKLSASLPVRSEADSVTVDDGRFNAPSTGVLRYRGKKLPLGNSVASRAMENFHFKSLEGSIDYHAGGEYASRISILGANPDVYDGYPIRLNLNLTGALPGVLQAALLTGDFSEAIIRLYRAEQSRLPPAN